MNKKVLFIIYCIFFTYYGAAAQNFLWGRSGGSSDPTQGPDDETVSDIATDKNGNVYVLTMMSGANRNVAGQTLSAYGYGDVILASFNAKGNLRWSKVIGSSGTDYAYNLALDGSDGVYFTCAVDNIDYAGHIDADATLTKNYQRQLLVKYDTSGAFQWYRQPEDPALPNANNWVNTQTVAMDVDNAGNVYWLMWLYPGLYGGSLTVSTQGIYILKYSASGSFSYIKPDMDADVYGILRTWMKIDDVNGRFYLSGSKDSRGSLTFGNNPVVNSMFVAAFDMNGNFIWERENILPYGFFGYRAAMDATGNIYLAGGSRSGPPTNDNFNGYEVKNGGHSSTPFIVKLDKNGNNIWAADANVNAGSSANAIAIRGNEVIISGNFPGLLEWPGYGGTGFNKPPNDGYDVFITRFDAGNGSVLGMDKIGSTSGNNEYPTCMVSDGMGNVYIGGEFAGDMNINALSNLATTGGQTDWFVVKYGDMWPADVNAFVKDKDVLFYPNPAYDKIHISHAGIGTLLQLHDVTGRTLYTQTLHADHEQIDLSPYPTGSYIIELTDKNGGRVVKKLVKN